MEKKAAPVILIAYNDPIFRMYIKRRCEDCMDCTVIEASSGAATVEIADQEAPDIIFIEKYLLDMDHTEVSAALRSLDGVKEAYIALQLTGSEFVEDLELINQLSYQKLLNGPLRSTDICTILQDAIRRFET
jgi:CheY-like chemotaxis protein